MGRFEKQEGSVVVKSISRRDIIPFFLFVTLAAALFLGSPPLGADPVMQANANVGAKAAQAAPHRPALFRDWPKPDAAIVFSGQQNGYLEPCGCSPEFQKGGLARRFGMIKTLQQKNWPLLMVDLGGTLDDHSKPPVEGKFIAGSEQAQVKLETALHAMQLMRYTALNVGPEELEVPHGFFGLMGLLINLENPPLPRAINANLGAPKDFLDAGLIFPFLTQQAGNSKVALIGMVGAKHKGRMTDPNLGGWQEPERVLAATLRKATQESTIQVLALYGDLEEARQLAQKFPELDIIIHASESEEPSGSEVWVNDKTLLVTIGSKGKYTGVIGVFRGNPRFRFELVPLDDRFDDDTSIRELLDKNYVEKLAALDLVAKAPKSPFDKNNPALGFVGSKKCGECHEKVYEFWKTTRHSHALETLVNGFDWKGKKIAPGKHVNPECVSCHTTGFFNRTGYDGTAATLHLGGNGCENCHGPGSEHVRLMSNPDLGAEEKREAMKMMHLGPQTDNRNTCTRCHDAENSPKFDLLHYWDQIDHGAEALDDKENWPKIREKLRAKK